MHHVPVRNCEVTNCCFNHDKLCHSLAIQVGDDTHPRCDTYSPSANSQCGLGELEAEVGACKVVDCTYNHNRLCNAQGITVSWREDSAECITFKPRS